MTRTTMLALLIGGILVAGQAAATTPAAVCRTECAPRVEEQCGTLAGKARRQCRRPLIRACKRTTPVVACTTTAEMTQLLGDRSFSAQADDALPTRLALCADRRFGLRELDEQQGEREEGGTWAVVINSGKLTIALAVERESPLPQPAEIRRFTVARTDTDAIQLNGLPVDTADATAACALGAGVPNGVGIQAVKNALANKQVRVIANEIVNGTALTHRKDMILCGTGGVRLKQTEIVSTTRTIEDFEGTWSVNNLNGISLQFELDLADGTTETRTFPVAVGDDGSIRIDGTLATLSDGNEACGVPSPAEQADLDLANELRATLADRVLVTVRNTATSQRTTEVTLCGAKNYSMDVTDSGPPVVTETTTGTWSVQVRDGFPVLVLTRGPGREPAELDIATDPDGDILLNGLPILDGDANLLQQVCS